MNGGEEAEWRHVMYQQSIDDRMFSMSDGSLRMKSYYPASTLKSITCYTTQKNRNKDLPFMVGSDGNISKGIHMKDPEPY